jgi:hypothetical protein
MFVKVNFRDNDFGKHVIEACNALMYDIANGTTGKDAIALYEKAKNEHGIENLRKAIVLASYGYYIALKGTCGYKLGPVDHDVRKHERILTYMDKETTIEEVRHINEVCPNGEVCYIDFYNMEVYLV